ncbi:MAG: methyltransferase [Acidobacteria bacterium]|nr:methyltransferase [Acidobacteriota bacterium]
MKNPNRPVDATSAVEARCNAQTIALAPLIFQAARLLRDLDILEVLKTSRTGLTLEEITEKVEVSRYGVIVLLEAGLAAGVVRSEDNRYFLTMTGVYILSDELTRNNMDVVHHCCFQAMYYLEDSIRECEPVGLKKVFGDWETIYAALPGLPEDARTSWFKWDHYYSDAAFAQALPIVFERGHRKLLDVGGNTGRWAFQCVNHSENVSVTVLDLPGLVAVAEKNIEERGLQERITTHAIDLLDGSNPFPEGFDAIWMSQFLVCFSEEDALELLKRAAAAMSQDTTLYILDNFWDRQDFEIASYCLQAFSLYFTCVANGRSRMYKASDIMTMVDMAGLKVERVIDDLGICSSLLICGRR